jgi:predicted Zn-dependent protease
MLRNKILSVSVWTFAFFMLLSTGSPAAGKGNVLFEAMHDEMERNTSQLVMDQFQTPYFIAYTIDDLQEISVEGSLGTLLQSKLNRSRNLSINLRVGTPARDNSNFKSLRSAFGRQGSRMAIEDDYDAIRNTLYLATDREYKEALKNLSKKNAYLQNRINKERPDDFIEQPANRSIDKAEVFDIDRRYFESLAREVTAVFKDYPMIHSSRFGIYITIENQYFLNSTGSKSLRGRRIYTLNLTMSGKNSDGEEVKNEDRIIVRNLKDLPDRKSLVSWALTNAKTMKALIAGDELEEYVGPVIFSGDAAGEFFRQLFAENISGLPSPIYENERLARMMPVPELGNKIKRRVLPAFIDVYDDPIRKRLGVMDLVGGYKVDDAGNLPRRIQLVKQGKLVNLPIGIAPTKKVAEPNGHSRGAVGMEISAQPANLIFESSDSVSYNHLVASMVELCQDYDLAHGLVIKKLGNPNDQQHRFSLFFGSASNGKSSLTMPLEAYKVFPDGSETPVRSLEFKNVTAKTLRDILQTGKKKHVYNYLIGDNTELPVSIVCPDILIEEMELQKSDAEAKKLPVLPSPLYPEDG